MKRRELLKYMGLAGAGLGTNFQISNAADAEDYTGPLLVLVEADGGWDTSSFCDPKTNVVGELEINHWSQSAEIQQAGNIPYALFANNSTLFEKYYDRMLVINGIDAQTNAHTAGIVHNWTGRLSRGYPSLNSMFSLHANPDLPMSYISNGGYTDGLNLIQSTRFNNPLEVRNILISNQARREHGPLLRESSWSLVQQAQQARLARMKDEAGITPRQRFSRELHYEARANRDALQRFVDILPAADQIEPYNWPNTIRSQIQMSLLAFKSNVAVCCDLKNGGFDSHDDHDWLQAEALSSLTDGIDYLWDYAETLGLADRLVVVVSSDFGRTPFYNSIGGKDHWSIGSTLVMRKNASWTNSVIGLTDEGQNAYAINPDTLERDDSNGTIIYPRHVHKALRKYLALEDEANDIRYPLSDTELFNFFDGDVA